MEFSKKELRNTNNVLLRRIERQVSVRNEKRDIAYTESLSAPKPMKTFDTFCSMELDGYSEPEQSLLEPVKEKTRLGLLRQRGGRD